MVVSTPLPAPSMRWDRGRMADRLSRRRIWSVRVLLGLAGLLAVLSCLALFANRQLLNAGNWADTSGAMLQSSQIRSQLSNYLVDELYADVDVAGELSANLPPRLQPLSAPAAGALRQVAVRSADTLLGRPRIQDLWKKANEATAQQFINIAENRSKAITQQGNAVVLDLRAVLTELIARLGLPKSLSDGLPQGSAKIKIMSGDQVGALQDGASVLRGLAVLLPALTFILLGLAVYESRGRRRRTLLYAGVCLIAAGALVLIARRVAGDAVVNGLVAQDSVKPAAQAAWDIGTRLLEQVGQATVVLGIPVVFGALLAGPSRWATALRRWSAPRLHEQPGVAYLVVGTALVLLFAWGPIPATRSLIPSLLIIALTLLGTEVLRRQIKEEFPPARAAATMPPDDGRPTGEPPKATVA
jgi:hypothetical protein